MSQSSGIDEVVKVVDHLYVLSGHLDTLLISALKLRVLLNCERTRQTKVSDESGLRRKTIKKQVADDAPKFGDLHRRSNLGTSPQKSLESVSHPSPDMKKYLEFQYQKDEGRSVIILTCLTQGTIS